jgi:hypothetical protein
VRNRRRSEVDDRVRDPVYAGIQETGIRLERVGGVREVDECGGAVPDERTDPAPGELNQRTARLHVFPGLEAVHATLDRLATRELVERLERRPGQKEERYRHLLDGQEPSAERPRDARDVGDIGPARAAPGLEARVAALEAEIVRLRTLLAQLSRPDDVPPSA